MYILPETLLVSVFIITTSKLGHPALLSQRMTRLHTDLPATFQTSAVGGAEFQPVGEACWHMGNTEVLTSFSSSF